uniref:Uncharacterized protein n=1 Tax=Musa acuminata subsp. malaccensis TaxID=214687 RepID=A0A804II07_MUSAM
MVSNHYKIKDESKKNSLLVNLIVNGFVFYGVWSFQVQINFM